MPPQFETIRNRLLGSGISPRVVARYEEELSDHFDDLVAEERARGHTMAEAEALASKRLGSVDSLVQAMIVQRSLISLSARHPWGIFFWGPALLVFTLLILSVTLLSEIEIRFGHPPVDLPWYVSTWMSIYFFHGFFLPVIVGIVLTVLAVRQRMSPVWPLLGPLGACTVFAVSMALLPYSSFHYAGGFEKSSFSDFVLIVIFQQLLSMLPYSVWIASRGIHLLAQRK
jgi:hypothetical protein